MEAFRTIEVKRSIFDNNDRQAEQLRRELKEKRVFLLNLMSSPGSGKTTTLQRTIEALKEELKIGIMEADIDSDVDARTIENMGVKVIQLHTGGMCHLDADMTRQGLDAMGTGSVDLAVLENVGNLVCPAEFDTGAVKNAMILSVPEGDDKPLKYPLMFSVCDVVLINKIDVMPYFDFDLEKCRENIRLRNPGAKVIPISAKTGEGVDAWADWLRTEVNTWREVRSSGSRTVNSSRIAAKEHLKSCKRAARRLQNGRKGGFVYGKFKTEDRETGKDGGRCCRGNEPDR